MSTSKKTKNPTSKATRKYQPKYNKPHMIKSKEDQEWALKQSPSVNRLWQQCWLSDPYGSRWMPLKHDLKDRTFRAAKKVIQEASLFLFKRETSIRDARETVSWLVLNLHGSRRMDYWRSETLEPNNNNPSKDFDSDNGNGLAENGSDLPSNGNDSPSSGNDLPLDGNQLPPILSKTTENQSSQGGLSIASVTPQKHLKGVSEACETEKIAQKARSFSASTPQGEGENRIRSALSAELMVGEICGGQAPHTPHAPPPQLDSAPDGYSVKGAPSGRVPAGKPLTEPPPSGQYEQPRGGRGECVPSSPPSTDVSHNPSTLANASPRSQSRANSPELTKKFNQETSERLDPESQENSPCHLEALKRQNQHYDDLKADPEHQEAYKAFFERTKAMLAEKIGNNAKTKEAKKFVREYQMKKRQEELNQLQNPSENPELPF